jgi:hypothetical protein
MKIDYLPKIELFNSKVFNGINGKILFICSEGFEERSMFFLQNIPEKKIFTDSIILKYIPEKKSRLEEFIPLVSTRTQNKPNVLIYNRFEPYLFEEEIQKSFSDINLFDEIVIDISVMSKLLILIVINSLNKYNRTLRIIYSEPDKYSPDIEVYEKSKDEITKSLALPSYGIHDVIRTPLLSSVIMQRSPSLIVAFLSFNEQLIKSLLSNINPTYLFLVNGVPPRLKWREKATAEIHSKIIREYSKDNPVDENGLLLRKTSTLNYIETFELLSNIYRQHCINRRIIIAPTGSKLQALACALFKNICPDVHIEYPTPESYYIEGYSSSKIINLFEMKFDNFSNEIEQIGEIYGLNS